MLKISSVDISFIDISVITRIDLLYFSILFIYDLKKCRTISRI